MPEGCTTTRRHWLRDEFGVAWRTFRKRHREPAREREIIAGAHEGLRVVELSSPSEIEAFFRDLASAGPS